MISNVLVPATVRQKILAEEERSKVAYLMAARKEGVAKGRA